MTDEGFCLIANIYKHFFTTAVKNVQPDAEPEADKSLWQEVDDIFSRPRHGKIFSILLISPHNAMGYIIHKARLGHCYDGGMNSLWVCLFYVNGPHRNLKCLTRPT